MQTAMTSKVLNRIGPVFGVLHDDAGHFWIVDTHDQTTVLLTPIELVELGCELIIAGVKEVR